MPVARRKRRVDAAPDDVWRLVSDPHHLPRWWPKATRVEAVDEEHFTLVLSTAKGKPVRMDFRRLETEPPSRLRFAQEVTGTPFERLLTEAITQIEVAADDGGAVVSIEQRQKLKGLNRLGGWMFTRATNRTLDEALDRLEEAV
jgi:uncharacterized protein YndB with AHSA1/START domain